jgi:hypothetical protein
VPATAGEDRTDAAAGQPVEQQRHGLGRVLEVGVQAHPRIGVRLVGQPPGERGVLPHVDGEIGDRDPGIGRGQRVRDGAAVVG